MEKDIILDPVISIAIISITLLAIILILRLIFHTILSISSFFYNRKNKTEKTQKTDIIPYKKDEEVLLRDKKTEEKKFEEEFKIEGVQKIGEDFEKQDEFFDEDKIVGIAKPIGFWTSLILGDQLSQILGRASALNDKSHKGFWVSMLEAQSRGLGRKKSRLL